MNPNEIHKIDEIKYVPKNLYLRLSRRKSAKYFIAYYFAVLIIMAIIGVLFLNSVYMTRNYIFNGDTFWAKIQKDSSLLRVQSFSAFTGVFLCCIAAFSIMNNILVVGHINAGGLKRRLQYANYVFLFFQIVLFVYSTAMLIMFTNLISLYIVLFVFSFYNLLNSIIYFLLIRRCLRRENLFMLSIRRMEAHKAEFYQEYLSKNGLKEIIPSNTKLAKK